MTPIRSRTRIAATLTAAIRILRAVPHARNKTEAEAEQRKIQSQIDGGFYCSTPALFSEFVDNEYLPWAEANKKSHADDRRRAKVLKNFFGNERLRNIAPYRIEKFKSSLIGVKTVRDTPRSESTINRYQALGSRILSLAGINGVIKALKAVVADAPAGDSVFMFSRNGVSTATIKRGFEIACTRAEITYGLTRVGGLTWHGLRHTLQPACGSKSFIRSTSKNSWATRPFQSRRTMRMARQKLCAERSID